MQFAILLFKRCCVVSFYRNLDEFAIYRAFLFLCMILTIGKFTARFSPRETSKLLRLKIITGAIILHDCIWQFIRLFYHSRFKPPQLEMTLSQLATPIIDLILVVPLLVKLAQNIAGLSNDAKMKLKSKLGIFNNCTYLDMHVPGISQRWIRVRKFLAKDTYVFLVLFSISCMSSGI